MINFVILVAINAIKLAKISVKEKVDYTRITMILWIESSVIVQVTSLQAILLWHLKIVCFTSECLSTDAGVGLDRFLPLKTRDVGGDGTVLPLALASGSESDLFMLDLESDSNKFTHHCRVEL